MIRKINHFSLIYFLFVVFFSFSLAKDCRLPENYYYDSKRGWFFGEVCVPKKEEKKEEKKEVKREEKKEEKKSVVAEETKEERLFKKYSSVPPEKYLDEKFLSSINPLEFRYAYDVVVGQYLMTKDPKWAKAAVSMMDFSRRRALAFAYDAYNITTQNDRLNPGAFYGRNSWSGPLMQAYRDQYIENYLKRKAKDIGLYMFTVSSESCPYCTEQNEVLRKLIKDFGFSTLVISYDSCVDYKEFECVVNKEHFDKFDIQVVPNMIMAFRKPDGSFAFARVGSGLTIYGEVIKNMYRYVRYYEEGKWEDWLEVGMPRFGGDKR